MATAPGEPAGPRGGRNPGISTRRARTRSEPRESPLFCVRAGMAALGREFGDKYSAEPARAPLPCPLGGGGGGKRRGRGARALPAAHPPANLERCGRSWRGGRGGCGAGGAAALGGRPRAPGIARAGPQRGRAGGAGPGGTLPAGVRVRVRRAGRGACNAGESLFGFRSYTRCGRGGGVLPPRPSPWRDERGRGRDAGSASEPPERWRPPALVI